MHQSSDYTNLTAVQEQVLAVKDRASLLLWYTADEPDGQEDALTSPGLASDLIHSIDPYHPVSLVLNCYDYYYTEYSARTDVILQDAYPIGMNATWSFRGTEVRSRASLVALIMLTTETLITSTSVYQDLRGLRLRRLHRRDRPVGHRASHRCS